MINRKMRSFLSGTSRSMEFSVVFYHDFSIHPSVLKGNFWSRVIRNAEFKCYSVQSIELLCIELLLVFDRFVKCNQDGHGG